MFIREMTTGECLNIVAQSKLGRLGCAYQNQPYVVPICFVCQDSYLYGFTTLGRKVEWMRTNPLVCVELDQINESDQWVSIVILGRFEELPDTGDWKHVLVRAHELLKQHAGWWEPAWAARSDRSADQPLDYIFYRIHIDQITGREATRTEGSKPPITTALANGSQPGWFRRVLRLVTSR